MAKKTRTSAQLKQEAIELKAKALADAQAMIKRANEMEKAERQGRVETLGKLTEKLIKGNITFEVFVRDAEEITGWKFEGKTQAFTKTNAEISASV